MFYSGHYTSRAVVECWIVFVCLLGVFGFISLAKLINYHLRRGRHLLGFSEIKVERPSSHA